MPFLNAKGDFATFVGEDQAAIFFVIDVPELAELLDHAGDRGLLHVERGSDIHHASVSLFLDEFVNSLEVVFGALTGDRGR